MALHKYTKQHEWALIEDNTAKVGITDFAQDQLGDIVFVELPKLGEIYKSGDEVAVVESVKAAAEVYTPMSGKVVEINQELENKPELVNSDAENTGWFFSIEISDSSELEELMDMDSYNAYIENLG